MLEINQLAFKYPKQASLLSIAHFELAKGERVFLRGPSGSGKSTLLSLITGTQQLQSGSIRILDTEFSTLSSRKKDAFRAEHMGFIFQNFNLIPFLSSIENVKLGCEFSKSRRNKAIKQAGSVEFAAMQLLDELEFSNELMHKNVAELSIGQQQRVAAARALIGAPELIIADEPTSALDHDSRERFINLLFKQLSQTQSSLLFVSHDASLATLFDKQYSFSELNGDAQCN